MNNKYFTYLKNILFPCIIFSTVTGAFTGLLIFLFKLTANYIIQISERLYAFTRENPQYFALLLLGCIVLGLASAFILKYTKNCRGGGIPTSVAILRGLIPFHWIKSLTLLPLSALLTYLCGIPLGNEGPSVQMGTAAGKGIVAMFSKKQTAWDRYIMTGGACAGFATATGAPVSGIFFALEEAHRRFTPMIIMVAATSVISGSAVMEFLCSSFNMTPRLFHFAPLSILSLKYIWLPVLIGVVCGICAGFFTKLYRAVNAFISHKLNKIPFFVKISAVFLITGILGFFISDCLGSGHSLIEYLIEEGGVWYLSVLVLLIRLVLLIFANNIGVTGGLFIPTLAFGALIGSISAKILIAINFIPQEHFAVTVIISITAFLSAFVRTPITAIIFAIEALGAQTNILPVIIGASLSYIVIEIMAVECFYETVIDSRIKDANQGKSPVVVDEYISVKPNSFIVGKEVRDILWPPSCVVLSVQKKGSEQAHTMGGISEGDILRLHYTTYDRDQTRKNLEAILGEDSSQAI